MDLKSECTNSTGSNRSLGGVVESDVVACIRHDEIQVIHVDNASVSSADASLPMLSDIYINRAPYDPSNIGIIQSEEVLYSVEDTDKQYAHFKGESAKDSTLWLLTWIISLNVFCLLIMALLVVILVIITKLWIGVPLKSEIKNILDDIKSDLDPAGNDPYRKTEPPSELEVAVEQLAQIKQYEQDLHKGLEDLSSSVQALRINLKVSPPTDCVDAFNMGYTQNGVYTIYPKSCAHAFRVFCDMESGGWTVVQRRLSGQVSFDRKWIEYREGFGEVKSSDYWLGNDLIHCLSIQRSYSLRIDMLVHHSWQSVQYDRFLVESETDNYRLRLGTIQDIGSTSDHVTNLLTSPPYGTSHANQPFSTPDRQNSPHHQNCAQKLRAGFWYNNCYVINLNGRFGCRKPECLCLWDAGCQPVSKVVMKIKPISRDNT